MIAQNEVNVQEELANKTVSHSLIFAKTQNGSKRAEMK